MMFYVQAGVKGFIVTDYRAINELVNHKASETEEDAATMAIQTGIDMDMQGTTYVDHLVQLVHKGKVSETLINESVLRILNVKYDLGLFQDPYRKVTEERAKKTLLNSNFLETAREIGRQSIVFLKNENSILPLQPKTKIALIGPLAKNKRSLIGNWSAAGDWKKAVTVS